MAACNSISMCRLEFEHTRVEGKKGMGTIVLWADHPRVINLLGVHIFY